MTTTIKSLVKKGLKKAVESKKQKICTYDSSSSYSNSEWEIGYCDTELIVDKHLKLDNPFMSDLQSIQPRPIKVTDPISVNVGAHEKSLENAKTG